VNRGLAVAPGDVGLALRAAEITARLPGREVDAASQALDLRRARAAPWRSAGGV
jgi:hypothetical protein